MAYDRTRTEAAAFGLIDEANVVMLGPFEVPYLAFRKSELDKIASLTEEPEALFDYFYEVVNYRFKGTLPREDFDEFADMPSVMSYFLDNRGGQKKPATVVEKPTGVV